MSIVRRKPSTKSYCMLQNQEPGRSMNQPSIQVGRKENAMTVRRSHRQALKSDKMQKDDWALGGKEGQ
ncbi:hypothetical protein NDU88_006041 [Pleurodeles waltl]|uniref:Uncharacterized protein n=1 Tax=Pleurodeles waltl TaxID=8319 RepID=A0AAV7QIY5_PLEWA|nr:hypothetical protein NDU88_006041 [Pleurodeles waltl]